MNRLPQQFLNSFRDPQIHLWLGRFFRFLRIMQKPRTLYEVRRMRESAAILILTKASTNNSEKSAQWITKTQMNSPIREDSSVASINEWCVATPCWYQ